MRNAIGHALAALVTASLLGGGGAAAGTLLVANKSDDTLSLVDLPEGRVVATLPTGAGPHEVAVSPDGRTAVVADYGGRGAEGSTLTVVDVPGASVASTMDLGRHTRPHGVVWLDDERLAVTTEGSRHVLVVAPREGKVLSAISTGQDVSHMIAVTPNGRAFVANIGSGTVTAVDLSSGKKLKDIPTGAGAEGIAATPDGREVWVTNRAADTVSVVDAGSLEVVAELPAEGFPIRAEITPDGKTALVSCARAGVVAFYDVAARELLARVKVAGEAEASSDRLFGDAFGDSPVPIGIEIAPDGETAWVACSNADVVAAFDVARRRPKGVVRAGREPDGMAYSAVDVRSEGGPGR